MLQTTDDKIFSTRRKRHLACIHGQLDRCYSKSENVTNLHTDKKNSSNSVSSIPAFLPHRRLCNHTCKASGDKKRLLPLALLLLQKYPTLIHSRLYPKTWILYQRGSNNRSFGYAIPGIPVLGNDQNKKASNVPRLCRILPCRCCDGSPLRSPDVPR